MTSPLTLSRLPWVWFTAWLLVGVGYALSFIGITSIGLFLLPLPVLATLLLARRRQATSGWPGLLSGLAVPVLYVAYLNRAGPGTTCTTVAGGQECTEVPSPWPWLAVGVILFVLGIAGFIYRQRRASRSRSSSRGADSWGAHAPAVRRAVRRGAGWLLAWLPFAVVAAGTLLALQSIESIRGDLLLFPSSTAAVLTPGEVGWRSPPTPGDSGAFPGVAAASLELEITSFDAGTQTSLVRPSLAFTDTLVAHLRLIDASHRALMPLAAVPRNAWAHLPVGIQISRCSGFFFPAAGCGASQAAIPLGQLVAYGGRDAVPLGASVQAPVTTSVYGWPNRFPSDVYAWDAYPEVTLPNRIVLATSGAGGSQNHSSVVPTRVSAYADPGLGDHTLTIHASMPGHRLFIDVAISRPLAYQATVYIVALLPLLLGAVVAHASSRRVAMNRSSRPVFDLGVIAGLIAAMLAVLPLRAVLVPADLNVASLTVLDYILVLDVLFIAAFVFLQYARFVTKPKALDHELKPMSSAVAVEKEQKKHGGAADQASAAKNGPDEADKDSDGEASGR